MTSETKAELQAELSPTSWKYVRSIGSGGTSSVHLVRHRALGHEAVMKLLAPVDVAQQEDLERRLLREGRLLKSLSHDAIVQVHDFGFTHSRRAFLVVEHLRGSTFSEVVRSGGPLSVLETLDVARQILGALAHAHDAGIVHRDLKPDNLVWLEPTADGPRQVKVLDFGIAKVLDPHAREKVGAVATEPGLMLGTPRYAAPEQIVASGVDARTDLYGLGGVLFFLLTGRAPFLGRDLVDILRAHMTEPPAPPSQLRSEVPRLLDAIVLRALAKRPQDRFASAAEMLAAISSLDADRAQHTAETVRLEDLKTQPLPTHALQMLTSQPEARRAPAEDVEAGCGEGPEGRAAGHRTSTGAAHSDALATRYQSSPLAAELAAQASASRHRAATDARPASEVLPTTPTPVRAPVRTAQPESQLSRPRPTFTWSYCLRILGLSVLVGLALIGLLHLLGLDP